MTPDPAALRLRAYAHHKLDCASRQVRCIDIGEYVPKGLDCTCGLTQVLALLSPGGETAGDLYLKAADEHFVHASDCSDDECRTCTLLINRMRLARKVWLNSSHQSVAAHRSPGGETETPEVIKTLKAEDDRHYCRYVEDAMRKPELLGAESKLVNQTFTLDNLHAFQEHSRLYGQHLGLMKAINVLSKLAAPRPAENPLDRVLLKMITQPLGNLLARIHGDGGHYQDKVGTIQAIVDAEKVVVARMQELAERPVETRWHPIATCDEGVDVIGYFPGFSEEYQRMVVHRLEGDWYQQDADLCPEPLEEHPTLWHPLPAPPTEKGSET